VSVVSRLRIIGGTWRSRLIDFPAVPGLRPTPDRVRETLFNWLGQDLAGLACLDLFAGSGVLGLEAASRGAVHVTLVERDGRALAALKRNAAALGASAVEIRRADALEFLALSDRRFDVVFLDPPYGQGWLERIEEPLSRLLAPQAMVYAEAERELAGLGKWRRLKHRQAGQVHYHLFESDIP
jgi:16S rRNA (guanine(966)-N(2))-methyltransferase RsmD